MTRRKTDQKKRAEANDHIQTQGQRQGHSHTSSKNTTRNYNIQAKDLKVKRKKAQTAF